MLLVTNQVYIMCVLWQGWFTTEMNKVTGLLFHDYLMAMLRTFKSHCGLNTAYVITDLSHSFIHTLMVHPSLPLTAGGDATQAVRVQAALLRALPAARVGLSLRQRAQVGARWPETRAGRAQVAPGAPEGGSVGEGQELRGDAAEAVEPVGGPESAADRVQLPPQAGSCLSCLALALGLANSIQKTKNERKVT